MAAEPTSTSDGSPVDFNVHKRDYGLLIAMLKWGGLAAILLAFLVMLILAY